LKNKNKLDSKQIDVNINNVFFPPKFILSIKIKEIKTEGVSPIMAQNNLLNAFGYLPKMNGNI